MGGRLYKVKCEGSVKPSLEPPSGAILCLDDSCHAFIKHLLYGLWSPEDEWNSALTWSKLGMFLVY